MANNTVDASRRVTVAMSGGVDSSVAAYLLVRDGYDCVGATMKLFYNDDIGIPRDHACCSLDDIEDAKTVCSRLGIPHFVYNFSDRFRECVIDRFIDAYEHGSTPNPCIDCNRYLKFDTLHRRARETECAYVATGHYARVGFDARTGRWALSRPADRKKDQTYVLYSLTPEQLAHTKFPLGDLTKDEVREIALREGFINAKKHDSQDICFVTDGDYASFIEERTGKKYPPGDFIDGDGRVLGRHNGIIRYTVGQRRGLGLSFPQPMYVSAVNVGDNTVTLSPESGLYSRTLWANDVNLISVAEITSPTRVYAKIRYQHTAAPATVTPEDGGVIRVDFDEPQRAVTAGQAVVMYDIETNETVIGGGTIINSQT